MFRGPLTNGAHDDGAGTSNSGPSGVAPAPVSRVRKEWQTLEDYSLALQLQDDEFSKHYDCNKSERRLMGHDTKLSKEEQRLEDKYAAEYWEQVRLDQAKEDERLAMELQRQLELEEQRAQQDHEAQDREIAQRLQSAEERKKRHEAEWHRKIVDQDALLAERLQCNEKNQNNDCNKVPPRPAFLPAGLSPEAMRAVHRSMRDGSEQPITAPSGLSHRQLQAVQRGLQYEDAKANQIARDAELAKRMQHNNQPDYHRLPREELENHVNDRTYEEPRNVRVAVSGSAQRINATNRGSSSDLISFDDDVSSSSSRTHSSLYDRTGPPPRPPPPNSDRGRSSVSSSSSGKSPITPEEPSLPSVPRRPIGGVSVLPRYAN